MAEPLTEAEIRAQLDALRRERADSERRRAALMGRLSLVTLAWWLWTVAITVLEAIP